MLMIMARCSGKINNFFEYLKYFFSVAPFCFCRNEILFLCNIFLVDMKHKIVFRTTQNFCFGHRLEFYVMVI